VTLTAKDVAQIASLLEESTFDEMVLELDGLKLTLRRGAGAVAGAMPLEPPAPERQPPSPAPAEPAAKPAAIADEALLEVTAPLLGTFYRAPKPGAAPFIEVGAAVEEETIIGIIEVMKLMNTVRAGARGTVAQICARDGALVEYGETLIRVSRAQA
jgi:acetyl-CoA carboxylase biotin carboxyl carrier protein